MATVSVGTLALLVIASLSVCTQSWPIKCRKLIEKPGNGKPTEYFVKINLALPVQKIVDMILELGTSECQGRHWRSSNASDALFTPVTGSHMIYEEGKHGFSAKMSDAAVMWVCDNDTVDYVEAIYNPPTDEGSGMTPTLGSILTPDTDENEPEGSGTGTVVPNTIPPSSNKCTKIKEYRDGDYHQFIVIMHQDTTPRFMSLFVQNVKDQSRKPDSKMIIKSIQSLGFVKQIIAEMNMNAMEYVCKNPKVKAIEYNGQISIPIIPIVTTETSTTMVTTTTPSTTTATTAAPSVASTPSTEQCNKLRGGRIISNRLNLCRIYMTATSTKSDCRKFIRRMKAMDNSVKNNVRFEVKQVGHDGQRPMIIAKLNSEALAKVCKSKNTDMIIRI